MNMKKLPALALCGIIAASFSACGSKNTSPTQTSIPDSPASQVVTADPALNAADPTTPGETAIQQHREGSLGDVNEDGNVTLTDAFMVLQYLEEPDKHPLSDKALDNADVYNRGDGITSDDYDAITNYYTGEIPELPVSVMGVNPADATVSLLQEEEETQSETTDAE